MTLGHCKQRIHLALSIVALCPCSASQQRYIVNVSSMTSYPILHSNGLKANKSPIYRIEITHLAPLSPHQHPHHATNNSRGRCVGRIPLFYPHAHLSPGSCNRDLGPKALNLLRLLLLIQTFDRPGLMDISVPWLLSRLMCQAQQAGDGYDGWIKLLLW